MGKLKTAALISLGIKGEMPHSIQLETLLCDARLGLWLSICSRVQGRRSDEPILVSGPSYMGPRDDLYWSMKQPI